MTAAAALTFRDEPRAADLVRVREIVESTGFFSGEELAVAIELLDDRLAKGPASDYRFLFGEEAGRVAGYTAYGRIALTRGSWDLYWIAVDPSTQGRGVGRALLVESERRIALGGGERVYVETSSRAQYDPTRRFYERCGYHVAATLPDFYAAGDGKVIFVRSVGVYTGASPSGTTQPPP
jgi:ribosomal protein S18 acetylase RimI-like enzyme